MQGYEDNTTWREIQKYFLPENRLDKSNMPQEYFLKSRRFHIHIDHYHTENPEARVILLHGAGGNGRLTSSIALPLQRAGMEVICPDLPLYGYTRYRGKITYGDWIECGKNLVHYYQKKKTRKTFLMGLSVGGMLACHIASKTQGVSGIIASCLLEQQDFEVQKAVVRHPLIASGGRRMMKIFKKNLGNLRFPLKWVAKMNTISNNKELNRLLLKDTGCSGALVPISFLYTMTYAHTRIRPETFTYCPLLLVHPGADRWTDISLSLRFFNRLACEKQLVVLRGGGHFPIEPEAVKQLEEACVRFIGGISKKEEGEKSSSERGKRSITV